MCGTERTTCAALLLFLVLSTRYRHDNIDSARRGHENSRAIVLGAWSVSKNIYLPHSVSHDQKPGRERAARALSDCNWTANRKAKLREGAEWSVALSPDRPFDPEMVSRVGEEPPLKPRSAEHRKGNCNFDSTFRDAYAKVCLRYQEWSSSRRTWSILSRASCKIETHNWNRIFIINVFEINNFVVREFLQIRNIVITTISQSLCIAVCLFVFLELL